MALTPNQRAAIQTAYDEAVATVNVVNGPVIYNNCPENVSILTKFLLSEGITQERWSSSFIWQSALLHCRQNDLLIPPPLKKTRSEREAELHAQDRAAGNALKALTHTRPEEKPRHTQEEIDAAKKAYEDALNPGAVLARKAAEKAEADTKAATEQKQLMALFPDPAQEFSTYTPEQLAAFKKLTPANMRLLGAKRDDCKRAKAQEAAAARRKSQ
jgi:hypothetical protein